MMRNENQDRALIARCTGLLDEVHEFLVGVVADGIGGMPNGGQWATIATSSFLYEMVSGHHPSLEQRLSAALNAANKRVFDLAKGRGGTTIAGFIIASNGVALAFSIGDSKVYRAERTGDLVQITVDDTIAAHLAAAGRKSASSAPEQKQLIQFAGVGQDLEPHIHDISREVFDGGSTLLVAATDGLSVLSRGLAAQLLLHAADARTAATRLVQSADWLGGPDNSSIVVVDIEEILRALSVPGQLRVARLADQNGSLDIATYVRVQESVAAPKARGSGQTRRGKKKDKRGGATSAAGVDRADVPVENEPPRRPPLPEASVEILDAGTNLKPRGAQQRNAATSETEAIDSAEALSFLRSDEPGSSVGPMAHSEVIEQKLIE
jgi:serine/threonine protein phosphatase PrpC